MGSAPMNGPQFLSGSPGFQPTGPGAPVHGRLEMEGNGIQTSAEASRMRPDDNPFLPSARDLGIQENTLYSGLSNGKNCLA